MPQRAVGLCVVLVGLLMVLCMGCTRNLTAGEQMIKDGRQLTDLGEKWVAGQKMKNRGQKLIERGQDKIADGKAKIEDGEQDMKTGERLVKEGTQLIQDSEAARLGGVRQN